jgi:hypothetical protein
MYLHPVLDGAFLSMCNFDAAAAAWCRCHCVILLHVQVELLYLSVDPYLRGRMINQKVGHSMHRRLTVNTAKLLHRGRGSHAK